MTVMSRRRSRYCSVIYDEKLVARGLLVDSDSVVALYSDLERMGYKASPVHPLTYRLCQSIQLLVRPRAESDFPSSRYQAVEQYTGVE
jgi:hypothetical protein